MLSQNKWLVTRGLKIIIEVHINVFIRIYHLNNYAISLPTIPSLGYISDKMNTFSHTFPQMKCEILCFIKVKENFITIKRRVSRTLKHPHLSFDIFEWVVWNIYQPHDLLSSTQSPSIILKLKTKNLYYNPTKKVIHYTYIILLYSNRCFLSIKLIDLHL